MADQYTVDDTREIYFGDHPDFDCEFVAEFDERESRWLLWSTRVYRNTSTGEHWAVDVGRGKTEMQEDEVYDPPRRVALVDERTDAKSVYVTLPAGDPVLADFLEAHGHHAAATAVRGIIKVWRNV